MRLCIFLEWDSALLKCVTLFLSAAPHVGAYKHSEYGNENDNVALVCVGHGYPLLTDWTWFKLDKDETKVGKGLIRLLHVEEQGIRY